jgi:hypothetical protein
MTVSQFQKFEIPTLLIQNNAENIDAEEEQLHLLGVLSDYRVGKKVLKTMHNDILSLDFTQKVFDSTAYIEEVLNLYYVSGMDEDYEKLQGTLFQGILDVLQYIMKNE